MKTKVRIMEVTKGEYRHYYIQVLRQPYKWSKNSFDVAGTITFQSNVSDDTSTRWYARNFECTTDKVENLEYMTKVAKHIASNCYNDAQPSEILKVIGAEEYLNYCGDYLPLSYIGHKIYKVFNRANELATYIYAANDIVAEKEFKKMLKKYPDFTMKDTGNTIQHNWQY